MLQELSRLENKRGKIVWTREILDRDASAEVIDHRLNASSATKAIHRPFLFRRFAFSKCRDVRTVGC